MAFGGGSSEIEGGSGRAGCGATQLRSGESDGSEVLVGYAMEAQQARARVLLKGRRIVRGL